MQALEQENLNKVGNCTTIQGDENAEEWHDVLLTGGKIWYDTFTKKHTKCKLVHQNNTVSMQTQEQETLNKVGNCTTIQGDENAEE
jgi:hypothetical protein